MQRERLLDNRGLNERDEPGCGRGIAEDYRRFAVGQARGRSPRYEQLANGVASQTNEPARCATLLPVIVLLAAGCFGGRRYVNERLDRRNWK